MFQITIDDLKQIVCKNDKAVQNFLMEINEYKCIKVQALQSKVLDLVENDKTHAETQDQANHE